MITRGEFRDSNGAYGVIIEHTKKEVEVILVTSGEVSSAYKNDGKEEYSFINKKAKELWRTISLGLRACTSKNGAPTPFVMGTAYRHEFMRSKKEYCIETYNGELVAAVVQGGDTYISIMYHDDKSIMPKGIPYIKLTKSSSEFNITSDPNDVQVRTVAEIALEKEDITWLRNKKYYIVNDDEQAEKIFSYLDDYNGIISYDTETTGLKINCFSKINSKYQKALNKWNEEHPDEQIKADRLVGIVFCTEPNVSYYFPCFNRRFKNLYEDLDSSVRRKLVKAIKARYTVGELRDSQGDMADYVRNTPEDEITSDVILMERVRNILETKHIVAHNGSFEWKTGWIYEIDTNLRDDTMILHQIMYKFRSTTSNRGESSALDYLSKRELGIEQWSLHDFFPDYHEDDTGTVRGKTNRRRKANSKIDFSYMDYEGTRIYAPTDGDVTYQIFMKYKRDMVKNHKELEYLYNVEVIVACAIAYMEFYGHRIDEEKIAEVRDKSAAELALVESELRQLIKYSSEKEIEAYNQLKRLIDDIEKATKAEDMELQKELKESVVKYTEKLNVAIESNHEHVLNLASPAQVSKLFYDDLGIPFSGDKKSVAKKAISSLLKARNDDGTNKYPVVHLYSEYKKIDTLMTKFFDNLPNFMYPGGYIFSSYGQISTATGRMSCRQPNAQQYPSAVTQIIVPRPGYVMMDADYSQIEYRVLVALAGEEKLAELFENPDNDYHTLMASRMYGVPYASVTPKMRGDAKSFNFGIPYGMGFRSLAILLTGMSGPSQIEEAKEKYELYFKDQPRIRKFFDQVKEMAQVNKFTKTFWNRYRYYSFVDKDGNENNARKAAALRQAGNAVIQGTAADIFKISVARNFMYIRRNKLLGLLLITNMIHDEQLFEINAERLNTQRILRDIGENMQFKIEGFPPLFIGAGFGETWSKSKGSMAEIHPHLLQTLSREADNLDIFTEEATDPKEVYKYMQSRVYEFRRNKVKDYLLNPENHHKEIHPAIGNLINLQFTYGHSKEKEGLSNAEFTKLCIAEFIKNNGLELDVNLFKVPDENLEDNQEDEEYDDGDELDYDEMDDMEFNQTDFALIDESSEVYGISIHELIREFGFLVNKTMRVCGIDARRLHYKQKDALVDYLEAHVCDESEPGSMQIVFLQDSNILNNTGIWVKGIEGSSLETRIKTMHINEESFTGTIHERLSG